MRLKANPSVLEWARIEAGLESPDAARELGIALNKLLSYEKGAETPDLGILRRMARKYRRPLAALGMPAPPPSSPKPEDFRTVGGVAPRLSTKTLHAIRVVEDRQASAAEILTVVTDLRLPVIFPAATLDTDIPRLAAAYRNHLGVSVDDQLSWSSASEAFRVWRWRVESLDVLVFTGRLPRGDCRGFSVWPSETLMPAIFVNSQEADEARCFTLLHEAAHLALRRTGICLEHDRLTDASKIERFSNIFAANVLMPLDAVHRVMSEFHGRIEKRDWDTPTLYQMAHRLRVSGLALALRLEELDLAPTGFYLDLEAIRKDEVWRGRAFGRAEHHERLLSRLGSRYASLVLGALSRGAITKIDAFRLMEAPARYFSDLQGLIVDREKRYGH